MLGAVVPIASTIVSRLHHSPRYGGSDGPLFSTVNGFSDRVASGDLAVIRQLDQLRKTDKAKVAWQKYWDEMVPIQPLTEAQVQLIRQLDPSKTGLVAHTGSAIYAQAGIQPPSLDQVLRGIDHVVSPNASVGSPAQGQEGSPPLSNAFSFLRPSSGGLPLWALLLIAGVGGYYIYKAIKKG